MKTLLYIFLILCLVGGLVAWIASMRIVRFRESLTVGDGCHFFIDEDRHSGRVIYITEDGEIIIEFPFGTHKTDITNIYP